MIGLGSQYLTAAGFGRYRITAASLGNLDLLGLGWLKAPARQAIIGAFGDDGMAVINATNEYLNGIAASDRDKATALAGFINEDPMMVCSLGLEPQLTVLPKMPWRWIKGDSVSYFDLGFKPYDDMCVRTFALRRGGGCIIGSRIGNANNIFVIADDAQSYNRVRFDAWNYSSFTYNNNVYTKWRILTNDLIHGKCMFDNTVVATFNRSHYTNALNLFVLACNNNGTAQHWDDKHPQFAYIDFENTSGGLDHRIAPYKGNKLIDIIEARVIENAGGGTLEYGYVLPDGTPWTPSTP